ncbi:MAG: hypothetical protein KDA17_06650 [Candidatus Saccharibacteria bacterium]|nr:hypothetical protein [Candidatus Saccharibacteria bacterium]
MQIQKITYYPGAKVKITAGDAFTNRTGVLVKKIAGKMWHVNINGMPLKFRENEFIPD